MLLIRANAIALAGAAAGFLGVSGTAIAADAVEFNEKGLTVDLAGDDLTLNLGGRLHLDAALYDDDITPFTDNVRVRRARAELGGRVLKDWRFRVDYQFNDIGKGFTNAWIAYDGIDGVELRGGNFIAPFSMEDMESSNTTPALERSLAQALAPGFLLGGAAKVHKKHWTLTAGYFFNPVALDPTVNNDRGRGVIARATLAPLNSARQTLHFGGSVEQRALDAGSATRVRTLPESGIADARLIDTRALADVEGFVGYGVEGAYRHKNLMLRGQYVARQNNAPALGDPRFTAAYAEATWIVTGESRKYSSTSGVFGGVRPKSKLGALELVARVSFLDLEDALVTGGRQTDYLAGANWQIARNVRVLVNYVHADASPNRNGDNESIDLYQTRAQIAF
ncbi:MAG: OprO/OprP family phosphate-selective porin [Parvularculaceae bacterium]